MMWWDNAACIGLAPMFDGVRGVAIQPAEIERVRRAFIVCAGCPVKAECGDEGQMNRYFGVWGGQLLTCGLPMSIGSPGSERYPCGTEQAWRRHRSHGKEPCRTCDTAHAELVAKQHAARQRADRRRRFLGVA